jgi:hypothetical protein
MGLPVKIGLFFMFILSYGLWALLMYRLTILLTKAQVMQRNYIVISQALGFSSYIGIFFFVWLLSGFLDAKFVGLLLVSQLMALALSSVAWAMLGSPKDNWGAYVFWEGCLIGMSNQWLTWAVSAISSIGFLGFPIAAGWIYFTGDIPSELATLRIFQVTIATLFLLGLIPVIRTVVPLLSSATLNENARARILIAQLGSFASWGLILSMVLWAFGIGSQSFALGGKISVNASWSVIGILCIFLLLVFITPYMAGIQRAKTLDRQFNSENEEMLVELVELLKLPQSESAIGNGLAELQALNKSQVKDLYSNFAQLRLADELESMDNSPEELSWQLSTLKHAFAYAKMGDPCIQQVNYLGMINADLENLKAVLDETTTISSRKEVLDDAAEVFEIRLERLHEDSNIKQRPVTAVWTMTILGSLASPVMSELGKLLASRVIHKS